MSNIQGILLCTTLYKLVVLLISTLYYSRAPPRKIYDFRPSEVVSDAIVLSKNMAETCCEV